MDEELKHLKEETRRLKCPPRVLEAVHRRIAADPAHSARGSRRPLFAVAAVGLAVLAITIGISQWPQPTLPPLADTPALTHDEKLAVVQEARLTFAVFGHALQQAVDRGEPILLRDAVVPLRNNLIQAKNKLVDPQ
jgi:hypothetical protein